MPVSGGGVVIIRLCFLNGDQLELSTESTGRSGTATGCDNQETRDSIREEVKLWYTMLTRFGCGHSAVTVHCMVDLELSPDRGNAGNPCRLVGINLLGSLLYQLPC